MQIKTSRKAGFTLVEIMIVVAIIGLLAAIAIPNFVKARTTAQTNACIANLKQLDGAKEQYALEEKLAPDAAVSLTDVAGGTDKHIKVSPECPAGGTYELTDVASAPTCTVGDPHVLPEP